MKAEVAQAHQATNVKQTDDCETHFARVPQQQTMAVMYYVKDATYSQPARATKYLC